MNFRTYLRVSRLIIVIPLLATKKVAKKIGVTISILNRREMKNITEVTNVVASIMFLASSHRLESRLEW
jgi:hypothetical protein